MSNLPSEVLLAIAELVEDNVVLLNLRLASQSFNALVWHKLRASNLPWFSAGGAATVNAVQEIVFRAHPEAEDRDLHDKYHSPQSGHSVDDDAVDEPVSALDVSILADIGYRSPPLGYTPECYQFHLPRSPQQQASYRGPPSIATRILLDHARADYDIVEFILRHKATLTRLKLVDFHVYGVEEGMYPRPWHATSILRRFQQELVGLRSFKLLASKTSGERFGYSFPQPLDECIDWRARSDTAPLDIPALEAWFRR
ncbi:hypothetical protein K438DRAFT_1971252 [Mycena galopus ATCC 62051]|nr:hypothetical protein K438DRAFT_1971252 [Mycena galopus ATCC 62051]